jgi:hypothetical protein
MRWSGVFEIRAPILVCFWREARETDLARSARVRCIVGARNGARWWKGFFFGFVLARLAASAPKHAAHRRQAACRGTTDAQTIPAVGALRSCFRGTLGRGRGWDGGEQGRRLHGGGSPSGARPGAVSRYTFFVPVAFIKVLRTADIVFCACRKHSLAFRRALREGESAGLGEEGWLACPSPPSSPSPFNSLRTTKHRVL